MLTAPLCVRESVCVCVCVVGRVASEPTPVGDEDGRRQLERGEARAWMRVRVEVIGDW